MKQEKVLVRLSDYKPYPFAIPQIELNFLIHEKYVRVESTMRIEPLFDNNSPLLLKGVNLELEEISVDNQVLLEDEYIIDGDNLIIRNLPKVPFFIRLINRINPFKNTSLEGLYFSESLLTSQCEAQGFRRICFHPDRPDVLSRYLVRIEADYEKYPLLLSNGNEKSRARLTTDPSRHEVIWDDPFPKPSYLFALVAGDLNRVVDTFCTRSGRKISINLYVDEGDELYCDHAIQSLKKAMIWDESIYGLEYDLNEYNIVAVRHFNMGAMENKGLNIFNSKLVLADSEIATDDELVRIESVIAHEYFHNWTGNRITCRDWFQLSLKEGLTVFRDQSFTADLHCAFVKRVEDVSFLRNTQFLEDYGPTSHAVKPDHYYEIDNFYTTTIYEKGAEIIRMLYTILGDKCFMNGMDLYLKKFDGLAATTEDFVNSILEGSSSDENQISFDIDQFSQWYYQSGTPNVSIRREWDQETGTLTLKVRQNNPNHIKNSKKDPLVIPLITAVVGTDGTCGQEHLFLIDKPQQDFVIEGNPRNQNIPTLSLFRRFSAPVRWESDISLKELFYLSKFDDDFFSRWNAVQKLMTLALIARASDTPNFDLEGDLLHTFEYLIDNLAEQHPEYLSTLLTLPCMPELEQFQQPSNPIGLYSARIFLESLFAQKYAAKLKSLLVITTPSCSKAWPLGQGERKLMSLIWRWLNLGGDIQIREDLCQVVDGNSMTLAKAALRALQPIDCKERELAMRNFYERWKDKPVILDSWFYFESSTPRADSLDRVHRLLDHPRFDDKAPNAVRALLGGFASNINSFHAHDGSGYRFISDQIVKLDKKNPITASRITKLFANWRNYLPSHSEAMYEALLTVVNADLSSNTREVIQLIMD